MTRIRGGHPRICRGWVDGIVEGAEPDTAQPQGTFPRGTVTSAVNLVSTPAGRLAMRRGSQVKRTLTNAASVAMQRVLGVWPYTQSGAVAVAHYLSGGVPETNLYRLTADLAFYTGSEATSRHALSWPTNTTTVPRPVVVELFESLYVVDAQVDYALRNPLQKMVLAGTVTSPTHNLDGATSAAIRAYCAAAYNGVLFVAGYDSAAGGEERAMLRHSYLGVDPAASNGFDKDAYAIIGSKGQRITALSPGRQVLLVAKANELYRVTGTGRGLPGWQYTIQQVENTQGVGVSNPYALCFAEGYWWGVGEAGPFRTDGTSVELLVAPRRDTWRQITNLRQAWVCYWPDRRLVKFGFNATPADTGRSATYPFVVWNWDVDRECWTGDDKFSADLHFAQAIPSLTVTGASTPPGPTGTPSSLASTIVSSTTTSLAVTWTNGDATAQTEVWLRNESGASTLHSLEAAAATSKTITGLDGGRVYYVKVRHKKDGLYSAFTSEATCYTRLISPSVVDVTGGETEPSVWSLYCSVTFPAYVPSGTTLSLTNDIPLDTPFVYPATGGATISPNYYPVAGPRTVNFSAVLTNTSWPVGYQTSATPTVDSMVLT